MANLSDLAQSLLKRFNGIPNVKIEDAENWTERAMLEHGYSVEADVPTDDQLLVLLYAEWDGTLQLALKTAYYFEYKDAEESVDKRLVTEQYRNLAGELWNKYQRKKIDKRTSAGSSFSIMNRADRR